MWLITSGLERPDQTVESGKGARLGSLADALRCHRPLGRPQRQVAILNQKQPTVVVGQHVVQQVQHLLQRAVGIGSKAQRACGAVEAFGPFAIAALGRQQKRVIESRRRLVGKRLHRRHRIDSQMLANHCQQTKDLLLPHQRRDHRAQPGEKPVQDTRRYRCVDKLGQNHVLRPADKHRLPAPHHFEETFSIFLGHLHQHPLGDHTAGLQIAQPRRNRVIVEANGVVAAVVAKDGNAQAKLTQLSADGGEDLLRIGGMAHLRRCVVERQQRLFSALALGDIGESSQRTGERRRRYTSASR